jgi:predicted HTH transcriptional regulator
MGLPAFLEPALAAVCESETVDFKRSLDTTSTAECLELVKDIVSLANSGGGAILLGVDDNGMAVGADMSKALAIDPADVTNKVYKYTE